MGTDAKHDGARLASRSFAGHLPARPNTVLGSVHACLGEMAEARRLVALGIEQHEIWWQFAKAPAWAPFREATN